MEFANEVRVIENEGGRRFCQHLTDTVRATNPAAIQIAEYWNEDRASALYPPPEGLGFDAELGDGLGMLCVIFSGRHRRARRRHWTLPRWRTPLWYRLPFPGAGVSCWTAPVRRGAIF
jgi:1,4-alpha-glucan branching enzyme